MKNILRIIIYKYIFFSLLAFMSLCFTAEAETGAFTSVQVHQSWESGIFKINNTQNPRMTAKAQNDYLTLLVLDFLGDSYIAQLFVGKNEGTRGTIFYTKPFETSCSVRIDLQNVFNTRCSINDDNQAYYITFLGSLDYRFLDESRKGQILRIKIDLETAPIYFNFSLNGFSSAHNRATSLIQNDSKYFDNSSKKKHPQSDASFFEI